MWWIHQIYVKYRQQVYIHFLNFIFIDFIFFFYFFAGVLFYSLLAEPRLQRTKIALILTKMDLAYRQMRNEALLILQLNRLKKEIRQNITVFETSALSEMGKDKILAWLAE